jgi:hypothetical protein
MVVMMYGLIALWVILLAGFELCVSNLWDFNENFIVFTPARLKKYCQSISEINCWKLYALFRIMNPIGTIGQFVHFIFVRGSIKWKKK